MIENASTWLSIIVPALVSIAGFAISYKSLSTSFMAEIKKQKFELQIDKMSDIPYDVLNLLNDIISEPNDSELNLALKKFNEILNSVYAYGSFEAVKIISELQSKNYEINKNMGNEKFKFEVFSLYILLASQVKRDLTGTTISPDYWFRMKLNDYNEHKPAIKLACNSVVKKLELENDFLIP